MYSKDVVNRALYLSDKWLSSYQVSNQLLEETGISVTPRTIQNFIKKNSWLKDLDTSVESKKTYDVKNWYYIFYKHEKDEYWDIEQVPYPVAVEMVDNIFKDYSKHWTDLSWEQIIQKYNLKAETRNLIKWRLRLYKDSNVVSPYTLENLSEEDMDGYLEGKINETIQDKYKSIFVKKDKSIKKREFIKYSNFFHSQHELLDLVRDVINNYEPKAIWKIDIPKIKNIDTVDIAFSDIHLWKKWTKEIVERIQIMTDYIISRQEKNINLYFLWDLAESLVEGGMHPWQVEEMEWLYWFDLMMYIVQVFEDMLLKLYKKWKKVKFIGMPGNHCFLRKENPLFLTEEWYKEFDYIVNNNLKLAQLNKDWLLTFDYPTWIIDEKRLWSFCKFEWKWNFNKLFTVTNKHKFIINWEKVDADSVNELNYIDTPKINWDYIFNNIDRLALLTIFDWTLAYANDNPKKEYRFKRIQFKISKPEKIEYIENELNELWIKYTKTKWTTSWWNVLQPYMIRVHWDCAREVNDLIWRKKEIPIKRYNINEESKKIVLDIVANTDWTLMDWNLRMYNTDKKLLDWFDTLFCISMYKQNRKWFSAKIKKTCYECRFLENYKLVRNDYIWEEDIVDFEMPEWNLFVKVWNTTFNHSNCRLSKNHNEDQQRTGALIIYELIKRWLSKTNIDIEYYREKTVTIYWQNFNFVFNHWDEWFDKKAQNNAEKILWNNVKNNNKKSVILYGDKHSIKCNEWKDYTSIWLPALAGVGSYDTRLDLHSEPWFVVMEKNISGNVDVLIKRF